MKYLIASCHKRYKKIKSLLGKELNKESIFIENKTDLTVENIKKINPRYIFFPHWSYIIPAEIYENYECVIFHMTDVPFGRGGSPLQNLIARGIYETKISAIKCVKELDAGPVYMKNHFPLYGSAEEIYLRAGEVIAGMIKNIIENNPKPVEQTGDPVIFKRRTPRESNISQLSSLEQIFDFIRMLDADGYPKAFLEIGNLRLEFSRASLKDDRIIADVIIREKDNHE